MKLSVIIPCKNEAGTVDRLLASLEAQTRPADEIIVVDSLSTDQTVRHANQFRDHLPLHVVATTQNGVARARNRGGDSATGDMLLFMDADTMLPNQFIEQFLAQINNRRLEAGGFTQRMDSHSLGIRVGSRIMNLYARIMQYTPWPIAFSCIFSSREVFATIKGFDAEIFIMEDYDYVLRAKRAHYKVGICTVPFTASDRRYRNSASHTIWKGIYAEIYRYTHGLKITRPLFRYDMGGDQSPNDITHDTSRSSDDRSSNL